MRDRKEEALRIMEALSGVDPELLERCGVKKKPIWQYGRAWAACIALLAVGAVSWGAFRFGATFHGAGFDGSRSGGAAENFAMEDAAGEDKMEETPGRGHQQAEKGEQPEENGTDAHRGQDDGGTPMDPPGDADGGQAAGGVSPDSGTEAGSRDWQQEEGMITDQGMPESPYQEIAYGQALDVEVLGDYIPAQLPAGYSLESVMARVSQEDGSTDSLLLIWTRGMDDLTLCISMVGTSRPDTVDVDRPETYDMRLYQIPYGESVPEAYRESVMHPVFAWEDMSLEIVESRMAASEGDTGDTVTPRGDFTVLYPDGVLVRFTGRGTPEEIWALFGE